MVLLGIVVGNDVLLVGMGLGQLAKIQPANHGALRSVLMSHRKAKVDEKPVSEILLELVEPTGSRYHPDQTGT